MTSAPARWLAGGAERRRSRQARQGRTLARAQCASVAGRLPLADRSHAAGDAERLELAHEPADIWISTEPGEIHSKPVAFLLADFGVLKTHNRPTFSSVGR